MIGTRDTPQDADPRGSLLERTLLGPQGLRAGWALLLFVILLGTLLALVGIDGRAFFLPTSAPTSGALTEQSWERFALSESLCLGALGTSTWLLSRIEQRPMRVYGLALSRRALPYLLQGIITGAIFLTLLVAVLTRSHLLVFTGTLLSPAGALHFALAWGGTFLLVALFEEYLLRGFLQFTLARGIAGLVRSTTTLAHPDAVGFWTAALLLSLLFGLGHSNNPGESPLGLLSAGLIGLVFCLSLWRTGSLWWAVGFHAAWDWVQSFIFGVADSGAMVQFHLLASHPVGRPLLSGGTTGPEGSLLILPTTCGIAAIVLLTLHPTPGNAAEPNTAP